MQNGHHTELAPSVAGELGANHLAMAVLSTGQFPIFSLFFFLEAEYITRTNVFIYLFIYLFFGLAVKIG